jgi:hypothetical protein
VTPETSRGKAAAPRFFDLLRSLRDHDVEFVLIGGFAVGFHGYPRATKDVNIVPEQSRDNLARLWSTLQELEARPVELEEFRPQELPVPFSFEALVEGGANWALETRLGRVDVMQWVQGADDYGELRSNAVELVAPEIGHAVWVAGLDDLISMKEAPGRDLDLIDITALRMAHGLEE